MNAEEPTTALERRSPADIDAPITAGELGTLYRFGKALAGSRFFKDAQQADQAFAKLIFGRDLGLSATQAMTDIHIVEGKPEMSANLQAAKVRSSEVYEYRIVELTEERCEIVFSRHGIEQHPPSEFTIADAKRAELAHKTKGGHVGMWEKYPRNMLFARAMSNGVAFHCPDVMNGIRVYAEGEIVERVPAPAEQSDGEEILEGTLADDTLAQADSGPDDTPLSEEESKELAEAITAAGVDDNDLTMLLTAVGVDCTDDLTQRSALELRQHLGGHLARKAAQS